VSKRVILRRLLDETRKPAKQDPNDSAGNNTRKVWCLVHTVGVSCFVKKHSGYDLKKNVRLVVGGGEHPETYVVHSKEFCEC